MVFTTVRKFSPDSSDLAYKNGTYTGPWMLTFFLFFLQENLQMSETFCKFVVENVNQDLIRNTCAKL